MRPTIGRPTIGPAALAIAAFVAVFIAAVPPGIVKAADAPTAAQIIESLSPTSGAAVTTRGIRLGGQPPAAGKTATPAGSGSAASPSADKPPEANLSVPFATGSAAISPAAARMLDQLGEALASPKLAGFKFRVEGHTDTVGAPETNKTLSEQRAASVTDYLATKHGIDRARLTPVGMGEDGLLVETGPGVASAANRRVLVVNLGA